MKSLDKLFTTLLKEIGEYCSVDTARDLEYLRSRAKHEGYSFYTITLPNFSQSVEDAVERGWIASTDFQGFRRSAGLPSFMKGFLRLMFESGGTLRSQDDETFTLALLCVRQFCRFAKKLLIPCTKTREQAAFRKYVETDRGLVSPRDSAGVDRYAHFMRTASVIWSTVFGLESTSDLIPKHGPGATAQRISGNQKYRIREWHSRLQRQFPFDHFGIPSLNALDLMDDVKFLSTEQERPVRVITVPKTLKTPRIIAIEPVCMQYTQQALMRYLVEKLESHPLTKGKINFTDQTINQRIAIKSSFDKSSATLDLSEASDRVHLHGAVDMLKNIPWLLKAILACRSKTAKVPGFDTIKLRKFASMGSALCFPIEAMYFFTVLVHSRLWSKGLHPTGRSVQLGARGTYVYGDDIIIPTDETDSAIEGLSAFGCKVNTTKSHWKSFFRESCGVDAYKGVNITPIYLRRRVPRFHRDSSGVVSGIATSNLLHKAGMWKTADLLKNQIEDVLGPLPTVLETTHGLGWTSFLGFDERNARVYTCDTQVPMVKTFKVRPRKFIDTLDGYPALMKCFLVSSEDTDKDHLQCSSRHGAVSRKRSWEPVY